jgi:hypothetical protein
MAGADRVDRWVRDGLSKYQRDLLPNEKAPRMDDAYRQYRAYDDTAAKRGGGVSAQVTGFDALRARFWKAADIPE